LNPIRGLEGDEVQGSKVGVQIGAALVLLIAGLFLLPHAFDPIYPAGDGPLWSRLLVVGIAWSFIGNGLIARRMRQESRTGNMLIAVGMLSALGSLIGTRVPLIWTLASSLQFLAFVLLIHLLLAFPDNRIRDSRSAQILLALAGVGFILDAGASVFYDPAAFGCTTCPPGLNLFLIRNSFELIALKDRIVTPLVYTSMLGLSITLAYRWVRASIPMRRVLAPMTLPALLWAMSYLMYLSFQLFIGQSIYAPPLFLYHALLYVFEVALLLLPVAFIVGLSRLRARRARVGDLIVELSDLPTAHQLEGALRRTLGDPLLRVGIWDKTSAAYVGTDDGPLDVPRAEDTVVATLLERHGEPLGMVIHDRALLDDPGMVASVTAAARLAVENERLQQEVLDQLAEVHASRARIVETADAERRRIERNLHDGAQQRLVALSLALRLAQAQLDDSDDPVRRSLVDASEELDRALAELRDLARGMYPAILVEGGLAAAVDALAARTPVPVEVLAMPERRLPTNVEATAYFVISEALTNVAKHAGASRASVSVRDDRTHLAVEVHDDGAGGADGKEGSGLRGLKDRVAALNGQLTVVSQSGEGTQVSARIPIPDPIPAVDVSDPSGAR